MPLCCPKQNWPESTITSDRVEHYQSKWNYINKGFSNTLGGSMSQNWTKRVVFIWKRILKRTSHFSVSCKFLLNTTFGYLKSNIKIEISESCME